MDTNKLVFLLLPLFLFSCNHSRIEQEIEAFSNSHIELMLDSMLSGRPLNEMIPIAQSQFVYVSLSELVDMLRWYFLPDSQ